MIYLHKQIDNEKMIFYAFMVFIVLAMLLQIASTTILEYNTYFPSFVGQSANIWQMGSEFDPNYQY